MKLKNCPFCGREVTIRTINRSEGGEMNYTNWIVACNSCDVTMEKPADNFYGRKPYSEEDVISMWNKRSEEPKTPKRWRAEYGQLYWFISSVGNVINTKDIYTSNDDARYEIGNYYKTDEEAEEASERMKIINELKLYTVKKAVGKYLPYWTIYCDRSNDTVDIRPALCSYAIRTSQPFMFISKEDAKAAIDAIGKERLIKYYFRLEED